MPSQHLRILVVGLIVSSASCATVEPLPVKEPTLEDKTASSGPSRGLPPPTGVEDGMRTLYAYANVYTDAAENKLKDSYTASDWTLGGTLLGMVGAITKSHRAGIAGAAIAGGGSTFSARYTLRVQADNYFGAAQAMECMANVLTYGKARTEAKPIRDHVHSLRVDEAHLDKSYLNDRINDVRRKLRRKQAAIDTSNVDISALQAAVQAQVDAKRAAEAAREKAKAADPNARAGGTSEMKLAIDAELEAEREVIRKALAVCSAAY